MIPEDKIAEIRERCDIVAVVKEFVPLKKVGSSFKGLCPFHPEKTPSFQVNPATKFYHCFGCHVSGDVLSFLMRLEGRSFPDVARQLAERAGVELPKGDPAQEAALRQERSRTDRLVGLLDGAAGFFMKQLEQHLLGAMAREELERRGVSASSAKSFRLGYAPHGWDGLVRWLSSQDWSTHEAEQAGLIVPRKGGTGHYDRFRHRLMFPIADAHGRIVAFSGRQLPLPPGESLPEAGEGGAKYVNSAESLLYKKGQILYGLFEGRVAIRREGFAVLCEGNFDLVALHQAGLQNAVAPMGTAFTEAHAALLKRFAERVVVLFDGDRAGRKAARAAFPILRGAGLTASVVTLPPGEDPDSFLRTRGAEPLRERIAAAPGIIDYLVDDAAAEAIGDPQKVAKAIAELGPVVAAVDNPIEQRLYLERIAQKFRISDLAAVKAQMARGAKAAIVDRPHVRGGLTRVPARVGGPELPGLECELVGALLDNPRLLSTPSAEKLGEVLTSASLRAIFQAAQAMTVSVGSIDAAALLAQLGTAHGATGWLEERLATQKYDEDLALKVLESGLSRLEMKKIEQQMTDLQRRVLDARRSGDEERALALTQQHVALARSAHGLMQGIKG